MKPTMPGRYHLQAPDGRISTVKVIDQNGELFAVQGHWLRSWAVPLTGVKGIWSSAA